MHGGGREGRGDLAVVVWWWAGSRARRHAVLVVKRWWWGSCALTGHTVLVVRIMHGGGREGRGDLAVVVWWWATASHGSLAFCRIHYLRIAFRIWRNCKFIPIVLLIHVVYYVRQITSVNLSISRENDSKCPSRCLFSARNCDPNLCRFNFGLIFCG